MKRFAGLFFVAVIVASMAGCSKSSPTAANDSGAKGDVLLSINLGKVGALMKQAQETAISLDSLTMDLTATGEPSVHRVFPLSGNDQQTVNLDIELAANKQWTLQATTYALRPSCPTCTNYYSQIIHQGSTSFNVAEGTNPPVNLTISALYSMLRVRINPIPDSATEISLYQGNDFSQLYSLWADTTFSRVSRPLTDTARIEYDWLNVQSFSQYIQVVIKGIWNGASVPLYWGTLTIPHVVAGADSSYSFNLGWVGPSSVTGQDSINVTIGNIGVITANGTPVDSVISGTPGDSIN